MICIIQKIRNKSSKNLIAILLSSLITMILLSLLSINIYAKTPQSYRDSLWEHGNRGTKVVSNADMLTASTFLKYIESNVFGDACRAAVRVKNPKTLNDIWDISECHEAQTFYNNAIVYGQYVDDRMALYDIDGSKFDRAMMKLSSLANKIFSVIIGFGLIVSLLCFTVIFMTLVWMPDNPMMRRKAMVDIVTSGISVILLGNSWIIISLFQSTFQRFWQTYAVYSKDWLTVANLVISEFKWFVTGLCGIGTLVALIMFVVNFAGLALAGSNASKRSGKMKDLLYCAIATAGLGSLTTITFFFWNLLG